MPLRRRAFTLVEVAAVVVILGVLASAATLSVVRLTTRATLEDAVRAAADFDAGARMLSTRDDEQVRLTIDPREHAILRESKAGLRRLTFPRDVTLSAVSASPQTIELRHGLGATYAVTLATSEQSITLLFAGVGGQVSQHEREDDVDAIFAQLQ